MARGRRPKFLKPTRKCDVCELARQPSPKKCKKSKGSQPVIDCKEFVPIWDENWT